MTIFLICVLGTVLGTAVLAIIQRGLLKPERDKEIPRFTVVSADGGRGVRGPVRTVVRVAPYR